MKSWASCYRPVVVGKSIDKKDLSFVSTNRVAFSAGALPQGTATIARSNGSRVLRVRASAIDSYESSSDFVKRMEKAWVISQCHDIKKFSRKDVPRYVDTIEMHGILRIHPAFAEKKKYCRYVVYGQQKGLQPFHQPRPIACSSCDSKGHVECKWCGGTGFFILGDNMLCQVPSRNTSCVICAGKGSKCCSDCKGTGFRAKWLGEPPISK